MQDNKPYIWLKTPGTSNELKILVQCSSTRGLDANPTSSIAARKLTLSFALNTTTPGELVDTTFDLDSVSGFSPTAVDLVTVHVLLGTSVKGSASAITTAGSTYFD